MKYKIGYLLIVLLSLFLTISCGSGFVTREMILATGSNGSSDSSGDTGTTEPEEEEEGPAVGSIKVSSNFKYILENGEIDPSFTGNIEELKKKIPSDASSFSPEFFNNNFYHIAGVNNVNVVDMSFINSSSHSWKLIDAPKAEYTYRGADFLSKGYATTEIDFFQYRSKHPLYASGGTYNSYTYDTAAGVEEKLMNRFYFYRWKGVSSAGGLDNYMIALDTYTGLIFAFTEIDFWTNIVGNDVPQTFKPVESYPGRKYFYEYDPAGHVNKDGSITLYDWYKADVNKSFDVAKAEAAPYTGLSPYADMSETIDAYLEEQGGYPVTGEISVTAKSFKNESYAAKFVIPDDIPLLGGVESDLTSRFDFTFATSIYEGADTDAPEKAERLIADVTTIEAGSSNTFNKPAFTKAFVNTEKPLNLELDAYIKRHDENAMLVVNVPGPVIIDLRENGGVPSLLTFNRGTYAWEDGKGFSLRAGETKDYTVVYSTSDGDLHVTYTLSWSEAISESKTGRVLVPFISKNENSPINLSVNGGGQGYTLEYVDTVEEEARKEQEIELNLELNNVYTDEEVMLTYISYDDTVVKKLTLDDKSIIKRGGTYGTTDITVKICIGSDIWKEQESTVAIKIVYPKEGYDTEFSPKDIVLTVKRRYEEVNDEG